MYKVVGADRREYGPVARETILEWIAQGRANAQTIVRFEDGAWRPLATFDEFKAALGLGGTIPPAGATFSSTSTSTAPPALVTPTYSAAEPPPFSGVASQRETNIASVVGLVLPLLCCCCPFIGPISGIIFSLVGLSQIRANPSRYSTSDALPKIALGVSIAILLLHIFLRIFNSAIVRMLPKGSFNF
jgi:hypothetical protein